MNAKVKACFWFDGQAAEAVDFYVSLLPDSRIDAISHYVEEMGLAPAGTVLAIDFTLAGTPFQAINGGPEFQLSEAASISIATRDQAETDHLWDALIGNGGTPSRCGWLKDRFGMSWQITPARATELLAGPQAGKVWPVFFTMSKIDLAPLEAAARA
ncbi:VOC family protein [Paracoccus benzoatiresistens]|jgi:predicted 3-demethylubiquinone-9 3-methyltransferase (glyoxalase superfamily)|uniref:VOC family protein n=1 Tax=Paracoccus benzoatiresistens TaxID=2997341 RepID=A0ABT4J2D0_9RHOB|nr:VOC family protein [Paracoccus sp. EF6]MCZ0960581.1 VOC family protein [Paracoccus sp. EF6]